MMRQINEQQILALAPNPAAAVNGRKISQKGGFVRLECAADDSFYLGECSGSGKNNYITTADFIDPAQPVFRCTCPSHQFPCKHSLALMYEMMSGKNFASCEVPEDILQKRAKKQARVEKSESTEEKKAKPSASTAKGNNAARTKKIKRQLEGLDLTSKLVGDLLTAGLGAMGGTALNTYRQLSKQLGDYYLPGPQRLLNRLILEIEAFQKDGEDSHYETAIDVMEKLHALTKKSNTYLKGKLESGDVAQDDNFLFEELGGIWKLDQLEELGLVKKDARIAQLSFWVAFDEARGEYIDTGCWADLETGEISLSYNYRPVKALKYVKQEDSIFGAMRIPSLCYYPGNGNRRVRWEGMESASLTKEEIQILQSFAAPALAPLVKDVKNLLKNTLADPAYIQLIHYKQIGQSPDGLVLQDDAGGTILLGDMPDMEKTVLRVGILPDPDLLKDQVLLGAFYFDKISKRIKLQPLSILTPESIVRLLY